MKKGLVFSGSLDKQHSSKESDYHGHWNEYRREFRSRNYGGLLIDEEKVGLGVTYNCRVLREWGDIGPAALQGLGDRVGARCEIKDRASGPVRGLGYAICGEIPAGKRCAGGILLTDLDSTIDYRGCSRDTVFPHHLIIFMINDMAVPDVIP